MADNVFQFPRVESSGRARFFEKRLSGEGDAFVYRARHLAPLPHSRRRHVLHAGRRRAGAFDWSGEYGFYFRKGGMFLDDPLLMERNATMPRMKGEVHVGADDKKICELMKPGDKASFFYDMEDYWEIEVEIERVVR